MSVRPTHSADERNANRRVGLLRLAIFGLGTVAIWGGVLPNLANIPSQKRYLERLDEAGIDASAMFYTELPPDRFLDVRPQKGASSSPPASANASLAELAPAVDPAAPLSR